MHTITLASQKQLVDLNEDRTVFDIEVSVIAEDTASKFEAVIINQTELDNGDINYQIHQGGMEARLVNNKNIYQNYFLCIRGEKGKKVNVTIKYNPDPQIAQEESFIQPREEEIPPLVKPPVLKRKSKKQESSIFSQRSLFIIIIVIGICI
ncbi:MAG TPA: hypothetical protein EYO58_13575 [Flavobacteriales bacterium]|nr:hypothetical protein [Flavobacteriales bacterium]